MIPWNKSRADELENIANGEISDEKSFGYLAESHLMDPTNPRVNTKFAAKFAKAGRMAEATKLFDFACRQMSPDILDDRSLSEELKLIARAYLEIGNLDKALILARSCGDSETEAEANKRMTVRNRPRTMMLPANCGYLAHAFLHQDWHFSVDSPDLHIETDVEVGAPFLWLRDEDSLGELTAARLGGLLKTNFIVCANHEIKRKAMGQLPFISAERFKVVLSRPLPNSFEPLKNSVKSGVHIEASSQEFQYLQDRIYEAGFEVAANYETALAWVFCKPSANKDDFYKLVMAQAHGVVPFVSAVPGLTDYVVGGHVYKLPFTRSHVSAMGESIIKHLENPETLAKRGKFIGREARSFFRTNNEVSDWISLLWNKSSITKSA